ncbi:MAG: oligosaccharide flippase family protein [Ignavibacteria bacterium]|nr:oligosaccharide flippase family protein [Ignavibacteria bacterium]
MIQKRTLYKGSVTGIIQLVVATLLTLFAIRIFVTYLGYDRYGVFSIITVIGNLNIFTNLGLNTALIKFISEQGKTKESDFDILVAIIILILILTPFSILLYLLGPLILKDFFNIPIELFDESIGLYKFMLIANYIILIGQLITSVIDAIQKIYITNLLQILYNLLYWGGISITALLGYSLQYVGLAITFASIIWFSFSLIAFKNLWGKIIFKDIKRNFFRILKKQLSYSIKIYLSGVINFFYEPLTKIIISKLFGVKEVGYFDIALKIRTQLWSLITKALYPLLPLIASIKEEKQIGFIVNDVEHKLLYIILPIISTIFVCTFSFVKLWLGGEVFLISISIIIVVCTYLIGSSVIPNYYYLMARRVDKTILLQFSNVAANIIFILVLYNIIGYYSVLIGFSSAIFTSLTLSLYYQNKYLKGMIFKNFVDLFKYLLILIIVTAVGYVSSILLGSDILKIIVPFVIILLLTVLLYRLFKIFSQDDFERYFEKNKRIKLILSKIFIS